MIGGDTSVTKRSNERCRLDENNIAHEVTRLGGQEAHRRGRSAKEAAVGFDDEDDNGDGVVLGRRWREHGEAGAIAITTEEESRAEKLCGRRIPTAKKLQRCSILRRLRREEEDPGEEMLGFRERGLRRSF